MGLRHGPFAALPAALPKGPVGAVQQQRQAGPILPICCTGPGHHSPECRMQCNVQMLSADSGMAAADEGGTVPLAQHAAPPERAGLPLAAWLRQWDWPRP